VITSVCFKTNEKATVIYEVTKVTFNELSDEAIQYYLTNYKPFDKAGAYGIQEWIGFVGVAKIEGSYANVMGLPTDKVYEYLSKLA
jgi:septum formation protein